jgi:sugar phosphate isomerase/epimerase
MKREIDSFLPLCEKYGVKIGLQHHYGPGLNNSMELRHILEDYDPKYVGAIWDAAHSGLAGEEPEQALDIVWEKLLLVNFKNAFYKRQNGPEASRAEYSRHFTTGRQGLASWERAIKHLKKLGYEGNICLTAEYSDEEKVNEYTAQDIVYIKYLFDEIYGQGSY